MTKHKFVFDLDGTLIDSKQQLKQGVVEMFDLLLQKCPDASFTIASGSRCNQIEEIIARINKQLKNGQIAFNIVANAGSYVKASNGAEIKEALSARDLIEINSALQEANPNAMVVYRTKTEDLLHMPKNVLDSTKHKIINSIAKKYWLTPKYVSQEDINKKIGNNEVCSIEIISPIKAKEIYSSLTRLVKNPLINISKGAAMEICTLGKLNALKVLFGGNLQNVIYFGDGKNDIEAMKAAQVSFAFGKKIDVLKSATFAIKDYKDATDFLFEGADISNNSRKQIEEAAGIKYSILKTSKKLKMFFSKQNKIFKNTSTLPKNKESKQQNSFKYSQKKNLQKQSLNTAKTSETPAPENSNLTETAKQEFPHNLL